MNNSLGALEMTSRVEPDAPAIPTPTAYRKRQKVSVACVPCRRKKMKCDAVHPICGACTKSTERAGCFYPSSRAKGKHSQDNNNLGELSFQLNAPDNLSIASSGYTASHSVDFGGGSVLAPSVSAANESTPAASGNSISQPPETCNVDSMNGVTGDSTQTRELFGGSSAGSFMRQVQAAIKAKQGLPLPNNHPNSTRTTTNASDRGLISRHDQDVLFVLPPRPLADRLMQAYWDFEWSLFPIVGRYELESVYQNLWDCSDYECTAVSMSLINICLALGCHYCDFIPTTDRGPMGQDFFNRADQLYQRSDLGPQLDKVQLLLLQSIYLQSTPDAFRCWMTGGEAIRMAQSLGLYHEQHYSSESVRCREQKRRVWHGCIWLDRVLSATLGRPGMIPRWLFGTTPLPSMIDDEFLDTQTVGLSTRPDLKPSIMAFSVKAFELYQILDRVLLEMYLTSTHENNFDEKLVQLLDIDKTLLEWKRSLPSHLRIQTTSTTNTDPILHRQATVLKIRFLHVRILLLRPALVMYTKVGSLASSGESNTVVDTSVCGLMVLQCSRLCFQLAREMIDTFNTKLDRKRIAGPLPSWWYSVLYIYTAATTILVGRFLTAYEGTADEFRTSQTWESAIEVLNTYSEVADSAKKCTSALEVLADNILPSRKGNTADTVQNPTPLSSEMSSKFDDFLNEQSKILPFSFDDFLR